MTPIHPSRVTAIASRATLSLALMAGPLAALPPASVAAADAPAIFDSSVVHAISVTYDQADYDAMIATFQASGDKDWIEASVTIDGVTYERVGLRLKGNSSLAGLGGRFGRRPGGAGGEPQTDVVGGPAPDVATTPGASPVPDASVAPDASSAPGRITRREFRGPGGADAASADAPEKLPWLIRLDRDIEGQNHGGISDLVVRSNNSRTSLNEAVALELLQAAGLASQEAAPTSFSVNGGTPVLRLIIENPDDAWQAARFEGPGALYKAESTGDWSYRGDDPDAYTDIFDQEAGKDVTDLAPLTEFLRFLNESDDATFAAELPSRFDVDAFARYLAMMELVQNFDDIDGPGNNAYLHLDAASGVFTIVPWDMNLAFGGFGGMRGGEGPDGPMVFRSDPDGVTPPDGTTPDEGAEGGLVRRGPGGRMRENPLVTRFRAVPAFEAAYQDQLTTLRSDLFDSGAAQAILDTWAGVLSAGATDLVDAATITAEATSLAERLTAAP